jgi:NADPH-dependent 2,4-dienoyl-CoA reductase/sulfur reductase-like enzyme
MKNYKYVIIGGGLVAGYAAEEFVNYGLEPGELLILSAESTLPYERPPLSKEFLIGNKEENQLLINPPELYHENGIELWLNSVVGRVDISGKTLFTSNSQVGFEKLLIATGSRPRRFDIPGSGLAGIHYLRRVEDAKRIQKVAKESDRAVVIGGSFIGMEVASVLSQKDVQVTMVFPEERVWEAFFNPGLSEYFENYYQDRGVVILPNTTISGFLGDHGELTHVVTGNDDELLADFVVAGIGVEPNTSIFNQTLDVDDGILVDSYLRTAVPAVYAAGDVARYNDEIYNETRRFEHWDNAVQQGKVVARNMMGAQEPFVHVPYFFSDVFDLSYEFWGDNTEWDELVLRGEMSDDSFSVWWLKDSHLVAAFIMDRPEIERETAPKWIQERKTLSVDVLGDVSQSLMEAIDNKSKEKK